MTSELIRSFEGERNILLTRRAAMRPDRLSVVDGRTLSSVSFSREIQCDHTDIRIRRGAWYFDFDLSFGLAEFERRTIGQQSSRQNALVDPGKSAERRRPVKQMNIDGLGAAVVRSP